VPESRGADGVIIPIFQLRFVGLPIAPGLNKKHGSDPAMFWTRKQKEEHRYYLLPGMGRSNRRRHQQFVRWAIVVGLLASAGFAYLLYLLSQPH